MEEATKETVSEPVEQTMEEAMKETVAEPVEQTMEEAMGEAEDFQSMYRENLRAMEEGQILSGTVIDITPDHVTVDVGYKSEGQIPIREFLRKDNKVDVRIGGPDRGLHREEEQRGRPPDPVQGKGRQGHHLARHQPVLPRRGK